MGGFGLRVGREFGCLWGRGCLGKKWMKMKGTCPIGESCTGKWKAVVGKKRLKVKETCPIGGTVCNETWSNERVLRQKIVMNNFFDGIRG